MVKIIIENKIKSPVTLHVSKDPSLKVGDLICIDGTNFETTKIKIREIITEAGIPSLKPKEYYVLEI